MAEGLRSTMIMDIEQDDANKPRVRIPDGEGGYKRHNSKTTWEGKVIPEEGHGAGAKASAYDDMKQERKHRTETYKASQTDSLLQEEARLKSEARKGNLNLNDSNRLKHEVALYKDIQAVRRFLRNPTPEALQQMTPSERAALQWAIDTGDDVKILNEYEAKDTKKREIKERDARLKTDPEYAADYNKREAANRMKYEKEWERVPKRNIYTAIPEYEPLTKRSPWGVVSIEKPVQ